MPLWSALGEYQALEIGAVGIVASLRPSSVAAFLGRLDEGRWAAQAHAGNGIVRAHLRADQGVEAIAGEIDGLRAFAVKDGGNLTLSRCPVEQKARLKVWGEPRGDWALMERVKGALDPRHVMNPGRFVGTI